MIEFDYKGPTARQPSKLIIRCTDADLFENIRETTNLCSQYLTHRVLDKSKT